MRSPPSTSRDRATVNGRRPLAFDYCSSRCDASAKEMTRVACLWPGSHAENRLLFSCKPAIVSGMKPFIALIFVTLLALPVKSAPGPPSQSKISVHLLSSYSSGAAQIIQARPRVIKILGTDSGMMQAARDFKAAAPDGKVVCRIYTSNAWSRTQDPAAAGSNFWQTILAPNLVNLSAADRALIDYVEGPNEGDSTPTWGST